MVKMPQHSPKYDPSIREELNKVGWLEVFPPVLKYAKSRAIMLKYLGHEEDPLDLVQEAILRAYGNGAGGTYRNWNREKCPELENFLIGIIRSITSNKAKHLLDFPVEPLFNNNGTSRDDITLESKDKTPEEDFIVKEELKPILDELDKLSNEDEELGMVILCLLDGISETRNIAKETGYDRKKVNNLLRKLRRRLKDFNPKIKKQSSTERWEE